MKAKIKSQHRKKFIPFFQTVIMGRPTKVSLKEVEDEPEKYINTPIGVMYEDRKALAKKIASRSKNAKPEKLDMRQGNRGGLFAKDYKSPKQKSVEKFQDDQKKLRAKVQKAHAAKLAQEAEAEKQKQKAIDAALKKQKESAKKPAAKTNSKATAKAEEETEAAKK